MDWNAIVKMRVRHDYYVEKLAEALDAEQFSIAPFDLVKKDGSGFIEVKVCEGQRPRFKISYDELRFAEIMKDKYIIYLIWKDEIIVVDYDHLLEWACGVSFEHQFGHRNSLQKDIELSEKRMCKLESMSRLLFLPLPFSS